jgi:hypothetical protein
MARRRAVPAGARHQRLPSARGDLGEHGGGVSGVSAQTRQMIGSLLVTLAIVAVTIAVVTVKFGPTSAAELEAREERQEQRLERQEERLERRQERLEEREDRRD